MSISSEGRSELRWWIDNSFTCFNPINVQSFSVVLTTDASSLGWGAVFNGHKTGGRWSSLESVMHINEIVISYPFRPSIFFGSNHSVSCSCSM